ncbi:Protein of unknown function [Gracilibacillus orientalis]|uniref:4 TMS phage holin, superfamily IV n=1 Tax=Gracilibacillus orientalis TaxID=334253 RepID=A0A1I4QYD5_9BACI|nr:DUF2512 family protein [Gracilibacillus orientalis]SFM45007.1 Protein of unknown function [Gracilibacillus orientalis]
MISFIVKIITIPIVLLLAMFMSDNVEYGAMWQPFLIILLLIGSGLALEYAVLNSKTLWTSVALDLITAFIILYFISNTFEGAYVSFGGALLISVILGVCEYMLHRFLISSKNVDKAPA